MPNPSQNKKGRERKSFFTVLSFAIGLSLVLSYFAFSPSGSYFVNQTGLGASVGKILGVQSESVGGGTNIGADSASAIEGVLLAQAGANNQGTARLQNPLGNNNGTLAGFLNKLLDVLIMLGSIVIVFMIILAGLKYVMARGNDSEIQAAHKQLTWTVIGAAILLGAKVISMVITNTVRDLSR